MKRLTATFCLTFAVVLVSWQVPGRAVRRCCVSANNRVVIDYLNLRETPLGLWTRAIQLPARRFEDDYDRKWAEGLAGIYENS